MGENWKISPAWPVICWCYDFQKNDALMIDIQYNYTEKNDSQNKLQNDYKENKVTQQNDT